MPYRKNNKQRRYQDGRKLRRYVRRWIVERTNAWFGQFRRLLVRHEHLLSTYRAFFYLACFWITLRQMSINLILIYGHSMCPSCRQPVSQSKECETEYRRSWLSFVEGLKLDL